MRHAWGTDPTSRSPDPFVNVHNPAVENLWTPRSHVRRLFERRRGEESHRWAHRAGCYLHNWRISLAKMRLHRTVKERSPRPPLAPHGVKVPILRGVNKCLPREAFCHRDLRKGRREKPPIPRLRVGGQQANPAAMRQFLWAIALATVALARGEAAHADLDWHELGEETATLLSDLIRVDTTNPPGGETAAANLLARKFRAEGVETEVVESAPGRGSLYARLPGDGSARPLILLSHLDVVLADPHEWRVSPLPRIRQRRHVYGRRALDAKGLAVIPALAVLALHQRHPALPRAHLLP